MSKNLWPLLRVQLINAVRGFRGNLSGKSKWGLILLPLMGLAFLPLIATVSGLYLGLFGAAKLMGQGQVVLTLALTGGQLACLMFGVFYVASAFYYGKDLNLLLPLPIRPGEIVLAKFISILVGEYLTMLPVVAPALAVYGIMADVAWTYWLFALVIYLLLPVVPLVLASLFTIVLMRVSNLRRNRDLWRVFGALLGVGMAFLFNMFNRFGRSNGNFVPDAQSMQAVLEQQKHVFEAAGKYFPTSRWGTDALREGAANLGAVPFLTYTAVALVALLVMIWAAEKLFFGGLVGGEESRSSGKVLTRDELARVTAQTRTPRWALLQREIRLLNRNPSFLMAALMPIIMVPVFMVLPMMQEKSLAGNIGRVAEFAHSPLVPAVALGVLLFINSMSSLAATAISREGRHFWISRSLPVAPRVQVQAKLLHALLFNLISIAMVLGALAFLHVLTPLTFLYVLAGGLVASAATGYAGIFVDILRPNLKWTEPQQAMKGNYNVLFGLLFIWVTIGLAAAVTAVTYMFVPSLTMPAVLALFLVEAGVMHPLTNAFADKRYGEIED